MKNIIALITTIAFLFFGCKKDDPKNNPPLPLTTSNLTIKIKYTFKGEPLEINTKTYVNKALDTFNISAFSHYLSNITLINASDTLNLANYNLSMAEYASTNTFTIANVRKSAWKKISFLLGVDANRNHTGLQTLDLSPSKGMFWTWNSGYIFIRLKGQLSSGKNIGLDIGGDDNLVSQSFDISKYNIDRENITLNLEIDVNEMLENPELYNFKTDATSIHSTTQPELAKLKANINNIAKLISVN